MPAQAQPYPGDLYRSQVARTAALRRRRGVVIAEGLHDPALINDLRVTRAFITDEGQPHVAREACALTP
jgi:hypothetical protein